LVEKTCCYGCWGRSEWTDWKLNNSSTRSVIANTDIIREKYSKQKQRANVNCIQFDETAECVISAGPILAQEQYIQRHDTVCAELHCNISKELGENYATNSYMITYRNWYKPLMKVMLPYYGTNNANRQNCF